MRQWITGTRGLLIVLVVALVSSVVMALRAPDTVEGDERGFLYYGTMQAEMFAGCVKGAPEACEDWRWAESYDGYGVHNPKLGLYMLGVVDHATRGLERDHRVPAMRVIWGVMGALCVVAMAMVGRGGGARLGGLVAAAVLLVHPVFRAAQVALLPDLPMLLFVLGALVCTQRGLAARRTRQGLWLLDAGVLVGLAVSCKLYALVLVPVVPGAMLIAWSRVGWRGWVGLALGLAIGAGVFVGTNPYLWSHPHEALVAMTSGHVLAQEGALTGLGSGLDSLRYLGWLPFSFPLVPSVTSRSEIVSLGPLWISWIGVALSALGLLMHIGRRRWLPALFLVSSFALTAWVITRFDPSWLYPRAFLLPSVAAAWLAAAILDSLGRPRRT